MLIRWFIVWLSSRFDAVDTAGRMLAVTFFRTFEERLFSRSLD